MSPVIHVKCLEESRVHELPKEKGLREGEEKRRRREK